MCVLKRTARPKPICWFSRSTEGYPSHGVGTYALGTTSDTSYDEIQVQLSDYETLGKPHSSALGPPVAGYEVQPGLEARRFCANSLRDGGVRTSLKPALAGHRRSGMAC